MTGNITLDVTALSDNEIAFANAAAWNNYWDNVTGNVELDAITTTIYTASPFDTALVPCYINVDGTDFVLVTTAMLNSLLTRVDTLNTAFETMRTQMRVAGLITAAQ